MMNVSLTSEIISLIEKEMALEWRNKHALNGIILYTASSIFICYLSFQFGQILSPIAWNALFWIVMLFAATNAISKSFFQESTERNFYYYFIVSPQGLILSKIIYNTGLMLTLSLLGYGMFSLVMGNPIADQGLYVVIMFLGATGFAGALTMISGIASKAGNNAVLMAILSFPVVLPILLMVIKASKNAMDGLDRASSYDEIIVLLAVNMIIITLSFLLFPYLWRV